MNALMSIIGYVTVLVVILLAIAIVRIVIGYASGLQGPIEFKGAEPETKETTEEHRFELEDVNDQPPSTL